MKEFIKNAANTVWNFIKAHKVECAILGVSTVGLAGATVVKIKKAPKTETPALPENTATEENAEENA